MRALLPLLLLAAPGPARAAALWTVGLPLGLPQYVEGRPLAGTVYAGIQGAGAAGAVVSGVALWSALEAEDGPTFDRWRLANAASITALGGAWFASAVDALHHRDVLAEQAGASARWWDAARRETPAPTLAAAP